MGHQFIGNFIEEAQFYWLFEKGGTILLGKFGRIVPEFLLLIYEIMLAVYWSFILWSKLDLEGCSSRSSSFNGGD